MSDTERGPLPFPCRRILIVADLGVSHRGDFGTAVRQITAAYRSGADAVRLPVYRTERCLHAGATAEFARWKRCELRRGELTRLAELAAELGLEFILSPLDVDSVEGSVELATRYRIGSGDNDFLPLITAIAGTGKPILLSTGGSDLDRIARSVDAIAGRRRLDRMPMALTLLHAVCWAPTPAEAINLRAIGTLGSRFGVPIGYSDHAIGIEACVLSAAVGATVIEKEFVAEVSPTRLDGDDAGTAVGPEAFAAMVEQIRQTEIRLGSGRKRVVEGERPILRLRRRSIVAARELRERETIGADDLTWLRPAIGLPPGCEPLLIGGTLRRSVAKHEPVQLDDVRMARAA